MPAKIFEGGLALFGGMADRVHEAHLAGRETFFDRSNDSQSHLDRLGGLGNNAETRVVGDLIQIGLREHDHSLWMIANEATDLDMRALADDDGMVTFTHEHGESLMGLVNEGAGRVGDLAPALTPRGTIDIGGSVRGDDDLTRGGAAQIV